MDFGENENDAGGVAKWPFYLAALFILILVLFFAYLELQVSNQLDTWQLITCILASGLASILVFIPHLIDRFLAIAFDPSNRKDEELHRKTYFDIKEMRNELEAFSVKIDKVPTLVDKIVSDSQNQDSSPDPIFSQIPNNLEEIKSNLSEKIKGLEELIVQTPLLPEPDPAIAQMVQNIPSIQNSIDSLSKQIKDLQQLVQSLPTEFPEPVVIEKNVPSPAFETPENLDTEEKEGIENEEENLPVQTESTTEKELEDDDNLTEETIDSTPAEKTAEDTEPHSEEIEYGDEETDEKIEQVPEQEIAEEPETTGQSEPGYEPSEVDLEREIDQEPEEIEVETTLENTIVEDSVDSPNDQGENTEEMNKSIPVQEEPSNEELPLDLPDPAETLRKVDAILKETDPDQIHKFEPIEEEEKETPRKSSTGTTSVVANVMIGIGNKPFLRGEGPGLNWDEGVPMNFVEIGKWAWSPPRKNASLTVQLYRNDNDPDQSGKIEIKAGEKIEITPNFG